MQSAFFALSSEFGHVNNLKMKNVTFLLEEWKDLNPYFTEWGQFTRAEICCLTIGSKTKILHVQTYSSTRKFEDDFKMSEIHWRSSVLLTKNWFSNLYVANLRIFLEDTFPIRWSSTLISFCGDSIQWSSTRKLFLPVSVSSTATIKLSMGFLVN